MVHWWVLCPPTLGFSNPQKWVLEKIENLHCHSVFYFSVAKFCHLVNFVFKYENKKFFGGFLVNKIWDDICFWNCQILHSALCSTYLFANGICEMDEDFKFETNLHNILGNPLVWNESNRIFTVQSTKTIVRIHISSIVLMLLNEETKD